MPTTAIASPAMFNFEQRFPSLAEQVILCIGDVMLDEFVYGEVSRISPEAPARVITVARQEVVVGGAGNVAHNIISLGARCIFLGVIGDDIAGSALKAAFEDAKPNVIPHLLVDASRPTTRKMRFVSEHHSAHLLRADWELAKPIGPKVEAQLIRRALAALPRVDAVVISDYAKGALTPRLIRAVIGRASRLKKPVVVDPKGSDFSIYRGATVITPNRKELAGATRMPVGSTRELTVAARVLGRTVESKMVLVTMGEDGMLLCNGKAPPVYVPAHAVNVCDVSGAGDTVVATLSVMLALGEDFEAAARAANAAASIVIGKKGTATVSAAELRARILPSAVLASEAKIVSDLAQLDCLLAQWRQQDLRIGFTNGVFDLLHPGHVKVLAAARAVCDRLVVGLNSDASAKRLKAEDRPIQDERARAEVLASLEAVDAIAVFSDNTPIELISRVRPNVLVTGSDYRRDQAVGVDLVKAHGGKVILVDVVKGFSTTRIV